MAADAPGEHEVGPLLLGRRAARDDVHLVAALADDVAVLDEQAAGDLADVLVAEQRDAALLVLEQADVGLGAEGLERAVLVARREQDLDELLGERLRRGGVDGPVERDDAAERAQRVALERGAVGAREVGGDGGAARVVVLDDHAGGRVAEVAQEGAGRVEVEDVVVGDLLAVVLADLREHVGARADLGVVGAALVRVLAVRQVRDLLEGAEVELRELLELLAEPARDRGVVAGGVGERLGGEPLARRQRQHPVALAELLEDGVVALGADDDDRERVVLRRGADHRRAADVDVLDDLLVARAEAAGGALERVEVHADEVDELDVVLRGLAQVLGVVAAGEQAGVELGMERLDAPVHDLREAGEVLDAADLQPGGHELPRGPARGDHLDAELGQPAGEVDDPALVGHGQQRTAHADLARLREQLPAFGGGRLGDGPSIDKRPVGPPHGAGRDRLG